VPGKAAAPADQEEVRKLMTQDPYYQFWSAMQRRSQEAALGVVVDPTERELSALIDKASICSPPPAAKIAGKPAGPVAPGRARRPARQPAPRPPLACSAVSLGSRHSSAARRVPHGLHARTTSPQVWCTTKASTSTWAERSGRNNLMGDTLLAYLREKHPHVPAPRRILDVWCAIGNSTVVWAARFPIGHRSRH
jgi:hypothetical protein